jgi:hypothetical protein
VRPVVIFRGNGKILVLMYSQELRSSDMKVATTDQLTMKSTTQLGQGMRIHTSLTAGTNSGDLTPIAQYWLCLAGCPFTGDPAQCLLDCQSDIEDAYS